MLRFRFKREHVIVSVILLITLTISSIFLIPMPAEFTLQGQLVPMSDIGVNGSVHFVFVESGITYNLAERWYVYLSYKNRQGQIDFVPISQGDFKDYESVYLEPESLTTTIENAIAIVDETADDINRNHETTILETIPQERMNQVLSQLEGYYGDSLGLMVAIGLYEEQKHIHFAEQLGIKIAGTGSLYEDGSVGSIGALKLKGEFS